MVRVLAAGADIDSEAKWTWRVSGHVDNMSISLELHGIIDGIGVP